MDRQSATGGASDAHPPDVSPRVGPPPPDVTAEAGFTPRSFALGFALVVALGILAPYTRNVLGSSLFDGEFLPLGAVWPVAMLAMVVGPLLVRLRPRWGLTEADIALVFIMGIAATSVTGDGLTAFLLSNIGAPWYGATPENRWLDIFGPHLKAWMIPTDEGRRITWLFTGRPPGAPIPWDAWTVPLFWWLSLFVASWIVQLSLVTLFRKQWVEHERLAFPLMEVPIEIARGTTRRAFWHRTGFWWGAIPTLAIVLWNIIPFFNTGWPAFPGTFGGLTIARSFPTINLHFWYPLIGLGYFVNLDVLLSVWLFHVLAVVEIGIMNRLGYNSGAPDIYSSASHAVGWQGFGAMAMLVLGMVWMARRHLWRTLKGAFGRDADTGGRELVSYRVAWLGAIAGTVYIAAWLARSGMQATAVAAFLFSTLVIWIGLTRIVIQTGLVFVRAPITAQSFTTSMLGPGNLSAATHTSIAASFAWMHTVFFSTTAFAHAAKLGSDLRLKRRHVLWALALGIVIAGAISIVLMLLWGYDKGGDNFLGWAFGGGKTRHWDMLAGKIQNGGSVDRAAVVHFTVGAIAMWGLTTLMYRVPGWPIHPIGLALSFTHPTSMMAFSVFLAWAAKRLIVGIGGRALYERGKPFFLGLVLGSFTGYIAGIVVDYFWFGQGLGHALYSL